MFVLSPNSKKYFAEETAIMLRKKTFENILKYFKEYGSEQYDKFWNYNIETIVDLRLNEFAKYEALTEICKYIECFVKKTSKERTIHFGVEKRMLKKYHDEKKRCLEKGIEFVAPEFSRRGRRGNRDLAMHGTYKFPFAKTILPVVKNSVYRRFDKWCELQGISKKEGCLMSLDAVVTLNPIEGLGEIEDFDIETIFDKKHLSEKKYISRKKIQTNLTGETYAKTMAIISRYNDDNKNKNKHPMALSVYLENAVEWFNKEVDLKYSNPDLLKEKEDIERQKESYRKIMGGE